LNRRIWIKILAFIAALYVSYTGTKHLGQRHLAEQEQNTQATQLNQKITTAANNAADDSTAFKNTNTFTDHSEVTGNGIVVKILPDDDKAGGDNGSRHQRFILKLSSGQTVLIVHNIDLAPRIELLSEGDTIVFKGVYISNDKGGLIHWTHRDPDGRHEDGWLKRNGRVYQ
jgi:hypothetical protein